MDRELGKSIAVTERDIVICTDCRRGGDQNRLATIRLNEGDTAGYENHKIVAQDFHTKCQGCDCQHHVGSSLILSFLNEINEGIDKRSTDG